nr:MAG TPA: hypothetical protein [Caudoviricetes sp.]
MSLGSVTSIDSIVLIAFLRSDFFRLALPLAIPPLRAISLRSSKLLVLDGRKFSIPCLFFFGCCCSVKFSLPFIPFHGYFKT